MRASNSKWARTFSSARYRYTWVESADWIFDDASFHSASFTFRVPY